MPLELVQYFLRDTEMDHLYRHFSFDLDGTLVDSLGVMRKAWEATVDEFHLSHDFSEYKREIGLPFPAIMKAIDIVDEEQEIEKFYFSQTEKMSESVRLIPGAYEFIGSVKSKGSDVSIVTSKPRENAENLLGRLGVQVDLLVCGDDPVGSKPSASPMQYIRSELEISDQDSSIYFGDMIIDLVFSVNSGIDYCHCNFGIGGRLSELLLPRPLSIDSWNDDRLAALY